MRTHCASCRGAASADLRETSRGDRYSGGRQTRYDAATPRAPRPWRCWLTRLAWLVDDVAANVNHAAASNWPIVSRLLPVMPGLLRNPEFFIGKCRLCTPSVRIVPGRLDVFHTDWSTNNT